MTLVKTELFKNFCRVTKPEDPYVYVHTVQLVVNNAVKNKVSDKHRRFRR